MIATYSLKDLPKVTSQIIDVCKHKILLFYGEMGVGKTTLIKEICKQLGVVDVISSPTFSLVNEYQTTDYQTIYHFDFYRITSTEEALDMGIEEYFESKNWCLIEWPENIKNLLPLNSVQIYLTQNEFGVRTINLKT